MRLDEEEIDDEEEEQERIDELLEAPSPRIRLELLRSAWPVARARRRSIRRWEGKRRKEERARERDTEKKEK